MFLNCDDEILREESSSIYLFFTLTRTVLIVLASMTALRLVSFLSMRSANDSIDAPFMPCG